MNYYIGLMSGTSMDGIDAALVEIPGNKLVCGIISKYSDDLKRRLQHVLRAKTITIPELCQLNTLIGRDFAKAALDLIQEAKVDAKQIKAIGSHGQTICHDAKADIPYTLQLGCPHTIAYLTGITTVADFRTRDIVNSGQGAPFAPLYHQELFAKSNETVAVVNIGGIANISIISPNKKTIGWDVGPGNCLIDAHINQVQGKPFDAHGAWAKQGRVIVPLLQQLLADRFISLTPPKSIGKEYYSLSWLQPLLKADDQAVDVQATLTAFTARIIANTLNHTDYRHIKHLYLCGGGCHNEFMVQSLKEFLPEVAVQSSACLGFDPDYIEAMMFAWLAEQNLMHKPIDLSYITGSKAPQILGAVYPSV